MKCSNCGAEAYRWKAAQNWKGNRWVLTQKVDVRFCTLYVLVEAGRNGIPWELADEYAIASVR
jgi:hypothetical protein